MGTGTAGLAYRRQGSGTTVVLVHGIPGQGRAWAQVEAALAQSFDVVTVDLLGFGASGGPSWPTIDAVGPAAQAAALATLLDELGINAALVVGHDFGVPIGVLLAGSRPDLVGGLVLLAGNAFPDTPIPFPLSLTTLPALGAVFSRMMFSTPSLRFMLRRGVGAGTPPPDPGLYLGDERQRRTIATIFSGALNRLDELYTPVARALDRLDMPVLVGWGGTDPFFSVSQGERTATAAKGTLHVFEGAGHFLPHERPADVARITADFAAALTR